MFARYFVDLDMPFGRAEASLLRAPREWLPDIAGAAGSEGDVLLAEVGFGPPHFRVSKRVAVSVGVPLRLPSKTLLPVTWRAAGVGSLFPEMEGDLEVAPFGPARSQLSMNARYHPPLGAVGAAADRALLHRVAEATIRGFVERVREKLEGLPPAAIAIRGGVVGA